MAICKDKIWLTMLMVKYFAKSNNFDFDDYCDDVIPIWAESPESLDGPSCAMVAEPIARCDE